MGRSCVDEPETLSDDQYLYRGRVSFHGRLGRVVPNVHALIYTFVCSSRYYRVPRFLKPIPAIPTVGLSTRRETIVVHTRRGSAEKSASPSRKD